MPEPEKEIQYHSELENDEPRQQVQMPVAERCNSVICYIRYLVSYIDKHSGYQHKEYQQQHTVCNQ